MMKNLFEQSRSHWVRYDHYELKTAEDGKRYITPGKSAKPDVYIFNDTATTEIYTAALEVAPLVNLVPECCTHFSNWNAWGIGHAMPEFAKKSFHQLWKEGKVK